MARSAAVTVCPTRNVESDKDFSKTLHTAILLFPTKLAATLIQ